MAVYNVNSTQLSQIFNSNGESINTAYDVSGDIVFTETPTVDPMDWSAMPSDYSANINSALTYINTYITENNFSIFTRQN